MLLGQQGWGEDEGEKSSGQSHGSNGRAERWNSDQLLNIPPVLSNAHVGDDGDGKLSDMLHLLLDEFLKLLRLFWNDVEEKLVVNLKGHLGLEPAVVDKLIDLEHGKLDEVRSSAL